ncbi:MAG: serine--tRNA ligase [Clostridia bacterium]
MLDINRIRENPEEIVRKLSKRNLAVDFTELLSWDKQRRELIFRTENRKSEKNIISSRIPAWKKEGRDVSSLLEDLKATADGIREDEAAIAELDKKIRGFLENLPNVPAEDVAAGDASRNTVERVFGEKPVFAFPVLDHVALCENLGLVDYQRGVKIGGNGFWLYRGKGAMMEWALLNYFIEEHLKDGYEFILPPHILNYACGYTAGQFPKFEEDVFWLEENEGKGYRQFILPTAETALINLHRDEILEESDLPCKYFAYTPCYRKEAGSYRAEERGMIRGHQFNKVEMFQFTKPEDSESALEELVGKAEGLMQGLGLHYRVAKLAAGDCSHAMGKTYDIEVWIPSMGIYKEVSSASNAYDYQARRGNIRYRRKEEKKNDFVHTLNASGLATSRIIPAIVEQFQRKDGSVAVPSVLRKWVGDDVISNG